MMLIYAYEAPFVDTITSVGYVLFSTSSSYSYLILPTIASQFTSVGLNAVNYGWSLVSDTQIAQLSQASSLITTSSLSIEDTN